MRPCGALRTVKWPTYLLPSIGHYLPPQAISPAAHLLPRSPPSPFVPLCTQPPRSPLTQHLSAIFNALQPTSHHAGQPTPSPHNPPPTSHAPPKKTPLPPPVAACRLAPCQRGATASCCEAGQNLAGFNDKAPLPGCECCFRPRCFRLNACQAVKQRTPVTLPARTAMQQETQLNGPAYASSGVLHALMAP